MIFLNQSGVNRFADDQKLDQGENWSTNQKAVFGTLFVYLFVSGILLFFHYPVSFLAIIVPTLMFFATTIINKVGSGDDLMFCTIIGVINALIKLSAIIVYISAFNMSDHASESRLGPKAASEDGNEPYDPDQTKSKNIFFYSLLVIEASIIFIIVFLRCNLRMCR